MLKATCKVLLFITLVLFIAFGASSAHAISSGMALSLPVAGENIVNGSLVSSGQVGFELSTIEYDPSFYGVVVSSPAVVFQNKSLAKSYPVTTNGTVQIRVNAKNGLVAVGDNITTSKTAGVGMKADFEGYVVGTATEACNEIDISKECLIYVSLAPRYSAGTKSGMKGPNLLLNVKKAATSPFLSPLTSMRYLIAVLTTAVSFALGLFFFGKSGRTGIEALGRNPLAAKKIGAGMILNFILLIFIVSAGLLISYMILVL